MTMALARTLACRLSRGPLRPTWSFTLEVVIRYLRLDWEATASWDFARLRDDMNRRPYPSKWRKRALSRDETLGGVETRVYAPAADPAPGAILYFHGGSFIYGSSKTTHADLLARLAIETRMEVWCAEYRLAPECPFPAQLEDALAAFDALASKGGAVIVAGDSSGGNLAAELAIALRDRGGQTPTAMVLLSPWADLEMRASSFAQNVAFDIGRREELVKHAAAYAGAVPLDDPRISPIHAHLADLPPTFVSYGGSEIPKGDIVAFADALSAAGVSVTRHEAVDLPHNPAFFADFHPNALASFQATVQFIIDHR